MRRLLIALCLTAATFASGGASAQTDPLGLRGDLAGEPTRVLVLGSPHLREMDAETVPLDHLGPLLDRLAVYDPDIIVIEASPGPACDLLTRYAAVYPGVAETYCADPSPALETLGMSAPEVSVALLEALAEPPHDPSPAERRRLAALFWAAGESWSAALQWLRLPEAERREGDGVGAELAGLLMQRLASRNENMAIGATLAARLGLERLHAMDDHTADAILIRTALIGAHDKLSETLQAIWARDIGGEKPMEEAALALLGSPEGLLAHYRTINMPEYGRMVIESDIGAAAATPDNDLIARHYVAWWQARGLRMAANVVEAAGNTPGAKVLVIVGVSHKPYFEAYLNQMFDIELVDSETVLN